ncbi:MAG: FAD-dependent monooxygenase, partial [Planctomycetaceae bacterium]|nr:FAD-dependent monooxygenase [Planctomycetaceae bacterium]
MKPVLIVGAGPVGLTMAVELTRYGVPVRIIDKTASRTDKSKALAVWSRTLELLERSRCADAFVAAGLKASAVNIFSGSEAVATVSFGDLDTPYSFALMLPQSETERLLEQQLESLGNRVERRVELTGFNEGGATVLGTLRHADGSEESVEAEWLIGCDGAHSSVRHLLGLEFLGDTLPSEFILADVHATGLTAPDDTLAAFWHHEGAVIFFPIAPGRYRVIADVGHEPRHDPTLAEVQSILDRRGPGGVTLSDPIWLAGFGINERMVKQYRHGRVFLAGDAAHIHSPAGGQGMNTGMQDAFNLAWKLALVVEGVAPPDLLDSYSAERSPIAKHVLSQTGRLTRVATAQNEIVQTVRNFIAHHAFGLSAVRHAAAASL